jgi:antitoxin ParD1/3/4
VPDIQKVSVALTGEQLAAIRAAVDGGEYAMTCEIVREAIRDWQAKREWRHEEIKRLRQSWEEGKASGPLASMNVDDLRQMARKQLQEAGKAPGSAGCRLNLGATVQADQ